MISSSYLLIELTPRHVRKLTFSRAEPDPGAFAEQSALVNWSVGESRVVPGRGLDGSLDCLLLTEPVKGMLPLERFYQEVASDLPLRVSEVWL